MPGSGTHEDGPVAPFIRGRFAGYQTPDGGLHFAVRLDGEDADRHFPVPPMLMRMLPGGRKNLEAMLAGVAAGDGNGVG